MHHPKFMKCKVHPKYKGVNPPRSKKRGCICKAIYAFKQFHKTVEVLTDKVMEEVIRTYSSTHRA